MILKPTETFKYAKNCRETILFEKDKEVSCDSLGLSPEQVEYLLKNCKIVKSSNLQKEPAKTIETEKAVLKVKEALKINKDNNQEDKAEYLKIENKDELIKYAEDKFSLKVDRRSGLQAIQEVIKNHLDEDNQ